jgi:hypothetical protein
MINDTTTKLQLNVLVQIINVCQSHKLDIWLRGGWAIDFLLGEITRSHSDIDLVTLVENRTQLEETLVSSGFQKIPISEFQTDFLKEGIDISFVFVRKENGRIFAHGIEDWEWRQDALPVHTCQINGVSSLVLSPHQLLDEKLVYESGTGRKPRQKDYESINILKRIIRELS